MTVFAVIYRFSADVATRDGARPEQRDYLRGLADEGLLLMSGPFTATGATVLCCCSGATTGHGSRLWSRTTRSRPPVSSPRSRWSSASR